MLGSVITQPWFTEGANVWQWVTSFVALAGWSFAFRVYWAHRCNVCHIRPGSHPVKGTTYRVCHRHHVPDAHRRMRTRHERRHPERLGHGESPGVGRSQASRAARGLKAPEEPPDPSNRQP